MKTELEAIVGILACQSDEWIAKNTDTTRKALGQRMSELSKPERIAKPKRRSVKHAMVANWAKADIYAMTDSSELLAYIAKLMKEIEPKKRKAKHGLEN